jgi:hypothetical protein
MVDAVAPGTSSDPNASNASPASILSASSLTLVRGA